MKQEMVIGFETSINTDLWIAAIDKICESESCETFAEAERILEDRIDENEELLQDYLIRKD